MNQSLLLNSGDLRSIFQANNKIIDEIKEFERSNSNYKEEIDELKQTLEKEIGREQPDMK